MEARGELVRPLPKQTGSYPASLLESRDVFVGAELLNLMSVIKKRDEINKYLYKIELVANYLPHLNILERFGRVGKTYIK